MHYSLFSLFCIQRDNAIIRLTWSTLWLCTWIYCFPLIKNSKSYLISLLLLHPVWFPPSEASLFCHLKYLITHSFPFFFVLLIKFCFMLSTFSLQIKIKKRNRRGQKNEGRFYCLFSRLGSLLALCSYVPIKS